MRWLAGNPPEQATPEASREGLAEAIGSAFDILRGDDDASDDDDAGDDLSDSTEPVTAFNVVARKPVQ
jgi:hypothetical protein